MREKIQIPAMKKSDMKTLFEKYGLADLMEHDKLECELCGITLDWDSIAGFIVQNGKPLPFCLNPVCVEEIHGRVKGE